MLLRIGASQSRTTRVLLHRTSQTSRTARQLCQHGVSQAEEAARKALEDPAAKAAWERRKCLAVLPKAYDYIMVRAGRSELTLDTALWRVAPRLHPTPSSNVLGSLPPHVRTSGVSCPASFLNPKRFEAPCMPDHLHSLAPRDEVIEQVSARKHSCHSSLRSFSYPQSLFATSLTVRPRALVEAYICEQHARHASLDPRDARAIVDMLADVAPEWLQLESCGKTGEQMVRLRRSKAFDSDLRATLVRMSLRRGEEGDSVAAFWRGT